MNRTYELLQGIQTSNFASIELAQITERLNFLAERLKNSATNDDGRPALERRILVLLGQGIGMLKVIEQELNGVHTAINTDDNEVDTVDVEPLRMVLERRTAP